MQTPKRDIRLLILAFAAICFLLGLTYAGRLARKAQTEVAIAQMEAKIVQAQNQQRALDRELRYIRSDAYLQKLAYDEFSMVKEGEQLLAVVPVEVAPIDVDDVALADTSADDVVISPWQRWLAQLGWR